MGKLVAGAILLFISFGILLAAYGSYVRIFAVVTDALGHAPRGTVKIGSNHVSKTKKEAIALARKSFGSRHWSADEELEIRYYNKERGYWMYAQEVEQIREENGVRYDGKRIRLKPFLVISASRDGSSSSPSS